jgi:O-antigen ligase
MVSGFGAAMLIILIELTFGGPIFGAIYHTSYAAFVDTVGPFWLTTGLALLVILVWPVVAIVRDRWGRVPAASPFLVLFVICYKVQFSAGVIGLAIGAGAAALSAVYGRRIGPIFGIAAVIVCLASPFVVLQLGDPTEAASRFAELPNSARHRLGIWSFTSHHITEHPMIGWGMNAAKHIGGGKNHIVDAGGLDLGEALPLHPHNAILQLWLELGVPGAILYSCLVVCLIVIASGAATSLAMGQLFAALVIANVSFGVWQAWWIAALWFGAFAGIVVFRSQPSASVSHGLG